MATLKAGDLRHRIQINALVETTDPENGAISSGWVPFATDVPAQVLPVSSAEMLKAGAEQASSRVRFVIRYGLAVTSDMQIVHEGRTFNILGDPIPDPTLRRHMTIDAEAGLRNG